METFFPVFKVYRRTGEKLRCGRAAQVSPQRPLLGEHEARVWETRAARGTFRLEGGFFRIWKPFSPFSTFIVERERNCCIVAR
jgi:hypothetical protein